MKRDASVFCDNVFLENTHGVYLPEGTSSVGSKQKVLPYLLINSLIQWNR